MSEVYRQQADEMPPTRSTVPVGGAFPDSARIEIEAIAHV